VSAEPAAHVGMDSEGVVTAWDEGAEMLFGSTAAMAVVGTHSATLRSDSADA
jgi:hypothetical protein